MHSHLSYFDHLLTHQTLALIALAGILPEDEIKEWSKEEVEKAFRRVVDINITGQDRVTRIAQRGNVIAGVRKRSDQHSHVEITSWSFLPPKNRRELSHVIEPVRDAFSLREISISLPHDWIGASLRSGLARKDEDMNFSGKLSIEQTSHWDRYYFF